MAMRRLNVEKQNCLGLDLNSGVESSASVKDQEKVWLVFEKIFNLF